MKDFSRNIIKETSIIKDALHALNSLGSKENLTLFVVNNSQQMVATLTDGDIRRGLLSGKNINDSITSVMFRNFSFLEKDRFSLDDIREIRKKEIELVPFLDSNKKILRVIDLKHLRSVLPLDAVIMAGGEGKRLKPLTDNLPKPLLKVGDKPIIEHNIDRLRSFGIDTIFISINYLGDKISAYFGDGKNKGISIRYIREDKPLGTIGSVNCIKDYSHDTILVMNSDLLTDIDVEDFYRSFIERKADLSVATIPYRVNVPFAVVETDEERILSLKEKPSYTYYSNAGIYLLRKELLKYIPAGTHYNATDLMEKLISEGKKVSYYPILGYWLDIGQAEDYEKAQEDIRHLKL